ncbi:MAG: hypothetical protein AB7G47_12450 [Mycolicibacterium sp.]|uniref:hypothetical protein n=1 Tax=Mycolicibacterium sp. TaxID=2320850 RepID=UPI003D0A4AB1
MNRDSSSLAVALIGLAAIGSAACTADPNETVQSGNSAEAVHPSLVTSDGPSPVGGMTSCTKAELAPAATGAAQALGEDNVYTIDQLMCADGWAVTAGILANKSDPNVGAPTSFVFEQEGQFWILQDKAKVCGTMPTTTTAPVDATIPAELFLSGCAAG